MGYKLNTKNTSKLFIFEKKLMRSKDEQDGHHHRSQSMDQTQSYNLFSAYEHDPEYLGRILFDKQSYWIYDGQTLSATEQEKLAGFIIRYKGAV